MFHISTEAAPEEELAPAEIRETQRTAESRCSPFDEKARRRTRVVIIVQWIFSSLLFHIN